MAFTLDQLYVWPPNFTEGTDTMGDNQRRVVVRLTGISSDASDASDTVVIDKSDLVGPNGVEPSSIVIEGIEWSMTGYDTLILEWDHTSDVEIARLIGEGEISWLSAGGLTDNGSGSTGDVTVTTTGGAANSAFQLTIWARLKE